MSVAPLVLSIQQMGQLHTVRYNMHDIVEHQHALKPNGLVRALPGAERLYGAATQNKVLVVAEGGVEAGVDLSQVTVASVSRVPSAHGISYRVRLPHAAVYAPEVHVQVVNHTPGICWIDDNIVPEATQAVEKRFATAARQANILQAAESNAVESLSRMHLLTGNSKVEFYF